MFAFIIIINTRNVMYEYTHRDHLHDSGYGSKPYQLQQLKCNITIKWLLNSINHGIWTTNTTAAHNSHRP